MNDPAYNRLREIGWRRKLTEAEAAQLQDVFDAHPEAREDWEIEVELQRTLDQLPEAPAVSSNFTARVLQSIAQESAVRTLPRFPRWWTGWLPRAAVAGLVVGAGVIGWHRHEVHARAVMAQNVAELGQALAVSKPELMDNFESIRRLSDSPPKADTELLALMQ